MEIMSKALATVAIAGFAIQQILEIFKPGVLLMIRKYIKSRESTATDRAISEADLMKWSMAILALLMGIATVGLTKISLLVFIEPDCEGGVGDFLVSALVLGAGTEGLNTLTKYFGYVKEGRKLSLAPAIEVSIIPSSITVKVNETFQFKSIVKNSVNIAVKWEVSHSAGGTIDHTGKYKAPNTVGVYQVVAVSVADETKHALATVTVSV